MNKISVLPRNFNIILEFFYNTKFETEVKFDRFKIDFYNSKLKLAFEYDGIQHYSVIQKIDSDLRLCLTNFSIELIIVSISKPCSFLRELTELP